MPIIKKILLHHNYSRIFYIIILAIISTHPISTQAENVNVVGDLTLTDPYTLMGDKHLANDYPPMNADDTINVIVEIPAGSVDKWEVDKSSGHLKWEFKDDQPRQVQYLGYPGNYGMIPQTLLSEAEGGDGDPIDVLLLGAALPRGSVIPSRLLGVLKMRDDGEQDDKLIAVPLDSPWAKLSSLEELDTEFSGITQIIELWFTHYKGPGKMKSLGFDGPDKAQDILNNAIQAFLQAQP